MSERFASVNLIAILIVGLGCAFYTYMTEPIDCTEHEMAARKMAVWIESIADNHAPIILSMSTTRWNRLIHKDEQSFEINEAENLREQQIVIDSKEHQHK